MSNGTNRLDIDPAARVIHEALEQLGWTLDSKAIAERVTRLDLGLPAEDEFSMLLSWMGKCKLVHKLDEMQAPPESKEYFRVPDLLAIFEHKERRIPVLIEVKTSEDNTISWRPDYFEGLQRYGQELGLPVLIAWKYKPIGCWSLFELCHFTKPNLNYKITVATAMKQSLMSLLAGDFALVLKAGVGLHLKMKKIRKVIDKDAKERWEAQIEDAYFTNGVGEQLKQLGQGLWPLFLANEHEESTREDDTHFYQSFVVPTKETMQWAHCIIAFLLKPKHAEPVRWRDVLMNHQVPIKFNELRRTVFEGISKEVVHYTFDVSPQAGATFMNETELT